MSELVEKDDGRDDEHKRQARSRRMCCQSETTDPIILRSHHHLFVAQAANARQKSPATLRARLIDRENFIQIRRRHSSRHSPTSVSAITRAISRNPIRRFRKAWTATSFAALRIVGARPPVRKQSCARPRQGNLSKSALFKRQLPDAREIEPERRRRDALRPRERIGDRRSHIRRGKMGKCRAVGISNEAMHDRLRMHDDAELLRGKPEQEMSLDHFKALVHQCRAVDGNFRAHRPVRMRDRLFRRHALPCARASTRGTARRTR